MKTKMQSPGAKMQGHPAGDLPPPIPPSDFTLPPDGWVQLAYPGEWPIQIPVADGQARDIVRVLDRQAFDAIVSNFRARREAEQKAGRWAGLLINRDHLARKPENSTEALAWITDIEHRPDGTLWVLPRWTGPGLAAVRGGEYRFLSGEYLPAHHEPLGGDRFRPLVLDGAALTNLPRLTNLKPICDRADAIAQPNSKGGETAARKGTQMDPSILTALGLPEDADAAAVADAIAALKAENETLTARVAELEAQLAEAQGKIEEKETAELEAEADTFVADRADVIADPAAVRAQYIADRDGTKALFGAIKPAAKINPPATPITDRAVAKAPGDRADAKTPGPTGIDRVKAALKRKDD